MKSPIGSEFPKYNAVFALLFLGALLPFIYISQYIYPSGDDFSFAWKGDMSTNFVETLKGEWLTWNGRYFSKILVLINPISNENYDVYQITPFLLVSIFVASLYTLFKRHLPGNFQQTALLVLSLT